MAFAGGALSQDCFSWSIRRWILVGLRGDLKLFEAKPPKSVLVISCVRLAVLTRLDEDFDDDGTCKLSYRNFCSKYRLMLGIDKVVASAILIQCEVAIALISSCLPSIFSLVKHTMGQRLSELWTRSYKRLTRSDMSSGGGRLPANAIGPPTESHARKELPQLRRGAKKPWDSDERLFEGNHGTNHDARAWPAMQADGSFGDTEMGMSMY